MSVGIGLGGLLLPGRVDAQPPGADAPVAEIGKGDPALRTVEARRRYQEGNAAMKLHQWQRAYEAYLAAWRQRPHWQIAGSLGEVELELGKYRDSADHLALFLREALFTAKGSKARESHESASGPDAAAEASFKSVAVWSFVAAGLVGGGTLAYELTRKRPGRPPMRGSVVVGPAGGAAMLQGEF